MTKGLKDKIHFQEIGCQVTAYLVAAISLVFYWTTVAPDASFWDCPEYITVASLLEVGHPPGNPFWALWMRVAVMFFPSYLHALVINLWSGFFMAWAAMFLTRIIYFCIKKILNPSNELLAVLSSCCGGLCFAFCSSAWFSAIEAEVYAMSAFFTGLILWLMTVWWDEKDPGKAKRILFTVIYLIGLSVGVHELGLLCLPVCCLVWSYKKWPRISPVKRFLWFMVSLVLTGIILICLTSGIYKFMSAIEILAVNRLGMAYMSGIFLTISLLIGLSALISATFQKNNAFQRVIRYGLFGALLLFTGSLSFALILVRAQASPPMNQGDPSDILSLTSYIGREQYGHTPLIYGRTPMSMPLFEESYAEGDTVPRYNRYLLEKGAPKYIKRLDNPRLFYRSGMMTAEDSVVNEKIAARSGNGYLLSDYRYQHKLTPELNIWFPRITSGKPEHLREYERLAGMTETNMDSVSISETMDSLGNFTTRKNIKGERPEVIGLRPTYAQNLKYFVNYQLGEMYFRYLGWNFVGREDDETGAEMPNYYGIPLIIGILGMIWLLLGGSVGKKVFWSVLLFMAMTGPAIVLYLNQTPLEPRERDYAFIGSYMGFSIFIGMGVAAFGKLLKMKKQGWGWKILPVLLLALGLPGLLCAMNFSANDRSGDFGPLQRGKAILSYSEPAIIFTQGDNYSFPLWYSQEVRGLGLDHTIIDLAYLSSPVYVVNLMKQGNKGIDLIARPEDILFGAYSFVDIPNHDNGEIPELKDLLRELYFEKEENPKFKHSSFRLPGNDSIVLRLKDISGGKRQMDFKHLMLLDILASNYGEENGKALYFLRITDKNFSRGLDSLLQNAPYGKVITYRPAL